MATKVQKWGNSQGIRVPRRVLEKARINVGDTVDVTTRNGQIVIRPAKRVRGKYKLKDLLARMPKDYKAEEVDWGPPVGKEAW